jgi:hypothetical protein
MAQISGQPQYVTQQPTTGNPFRELNQQWSIGLYDCCDDIGQCKYCCSHILDFATMNA